ncbi:hypothetical protein RhiirA1_472206 [Rhizophagus irregularis]|uniref:Uncharacterized protein n=1 Tax=Rhizophagus irregularis TaxID=588596 RepID=A0A2N0R2T2_9GLOM|nr:hypothetical protein RhiirA1_472206 [Rhizophagus irregularis]
MEDSGSDISNSDTENPNNKNNPSKLTHTSLENSIKEDYVTDSAADIRGNSDTPSQPKNTDNSLSPSPPKDSAAPSAPGYNTSGTDVSMHALKDKENSSLDMYNFQAAAVPNAFSEFIKKYSTNRAMIDAVKNLLLETYHFYIGRARISGSGDQKRLLPPNTKDIHLAFLMCEIGVMAVNVPLSLNLYKLKKWTYITFKSQQMMDTTMKQSIALQGRRFTWELLQNTNKLCHRCGKLRCAPIACVMNNSRGHSCTCNSVARLKEWLNISQPSKNSLTNQNKQRFHSQSKDRSNSH